MKRGIAWITRTYAQLLNAIDGFVGQLLERHLCATEAKREAETMAAVQDALREPPRPSRGWVGYRMADGSIRWYENDWVAPGGRIIISL